MDQAQIEALRDAPVPAGQLWINGQHRCAQDDATIDVISPLNGKVLTTIARGSAADMDSAITAARAAFDDGRWSDMAPGARKAILLKWAALIEANALELAVLGVRDNGTEIGMALKAEPMSAASTIRYAAEAIDKLYGQIAPTDTSTLGLVHREPVGVVGAIVPWNFPLMIGAWKLGPALAVGNTVVMKPPETASLTLLRIAELATQAGLPDGVLNIVTGFGAEAGEALSLSMNVDVIAFTGSGPVGRRLMTNAAASNFKRVYLELGGKSPNVVFADAPDLNVAAKMAVYGVFRNAGQVCIAGTRLLVDRAIQDDFVARMVAITEDMVLGDPLDLGTMAGAVNNAAQLEQNLQFVADARAAGATICTGGERILEDTGGYFIAPTIISNLKTTDDVVRKEVFGPILAVIPFDSEDEAVALANDTEYGLAAGVWTANLSRAHRMVRKINAGVVHVNTYGGADGSVPLGGRKQSGNGSDKSLHAFDKFLNLKTAWIKL
ncbi:aldehyde dehydrogenase family protein [uncultured Tateyamaria sp.]|uniref:aldehyde dehydrogenase family protein n=1 Tax=uncultured Tateyamaria sp. TaxID=455651 RepID=UPI00262D3F13|nr:aldehyde dehydrogenase family protein [uncultured Tateyamaria sp.]